MTCQRIGMPPISTSGLGIARACSCRRVPRPPQRIATGGCDSQGLWFTVSQSRPTSALEESRTRGPPCRPAAGCGTLSARDTLEHVGGDVEVGVHGADVVELFERVDQAHELAGGGLVDRHDARGAMDELG